eukprot:9317109-Alexandrium_andersonii.AAC.1
MEGGAGGGWRRQCKCGDGGGSVVVMDACGSEGAGEVMVDVANEAVVGAVRCRWDYGGEVEARSWGGKRGSGVGGGSGCGGGQAQ